MDFGNMMDQWLKENPVPNKDAEAPVNPRNAAERRRRLRRKKPDATIDLHGLLQDEAWIALDRFFEESLQKGLDKILIIHGKGNHSEGEAPLKRLSIKFIENCPFAGENGQSSSAEGGSGATWVLLKKNMRKTAEINDGEDTGNPKPEEGPGQTEHTG